MQITKAIRLVTLVLLGLAVPALRLAVAQQAEPRHGTPSTLELTYDYTRTNGPPGDCGCIHLNGGGVAYVRPVHDSTVSLVAQVGATHAGGIGTLNYDLTLLTYTAGARYSPRLRRTYLQPYGELAIGGAYASGSLSKAPSLAGNGIGNSFAATVGGGINLKLRQRLSFKLIDVEYLTTNYANGDTDHQNDLRLSSGLIVSLFSTKH
jgi:hypothetical protein